MKYTSINKGLIIALTGGIGSGKSFALQCFKHLGFHTYSLDSIIASLYKRGMPLYEPIKALFPSAVSEMGVSHQKLADIVFADLKQLAKLEQMVHPVIRSHMREFIRKHSQQKHHRSIVIEIPLLFEAGNSKEFDMVISTITKPAIQEIRACERKNMTKEKFAAIISKQVSEKYRVNNSDIIICTTYNKSHTFKQIKWLASGRSFARNSFGYRDHGSKGPRWR